VNREFFFECFLSPLSFASSKGETMETTAPPLSSPQTEIKQLLSADPSRATVWLLKQNQKIREFWRKIE
jgi:hypothetical protein